MNQKIALFLYCILSASICMAQNSISGRVSDVNGEPLEAVNIVIFTKAKQYGGTTDLNGNYTIELGDVRTITTEYRYLGFETETRIFSFINKNKVVKNIVLKEKSSTIDGDFTITGRSSPKSGAVTRIDPKLAEKIPLGGFEKLLVLQALGASSNNELSSGYTVRGGNFDENLVYVNGFEIYRPFLVRSGQSEGLSFINPNLVGSAEFSTGGFEAKYGDKLSSVLDIKYKRPEDFAGSVSASLLGSEVHLEGRKNRFSFLTGFRYKSNQLLLNALPTEGQYKPLFVDWQTLFNFQVNENWQLQYISYFARNRYQFYPQYEERNFGNITQAFQLDIFFEGAEKNTYAANMNGFAANYTSNDNRLSLKFQAANYLTTETEAFDIIGQYYIGLLESNLGEGFAEVTQSYGVGTYHDWARNRISSSLNTVMHRGFYASKSRKHYLSWGTRWQHENIEDKLNEWQRVDSAGYSLPYFVEQVPNESEVVTLNRLLNSENSLQSHRFSGFLQDSWDVGEKERFNITGGVRFNYWTVNNEFAVTPRMQFHYKPERKYRGELNDSTKIKRWKARRDSTDLTMRFSTGLYYQPPFYRELRNLEGVVNRDVLSQKSFHAVFGLDYEFYLWNRPFKLSTEAYYKYLWDLVPYDVDNVLIRYYGDNLAKGYAYGIDLRVNGQFVKGVESWFSLSLLNTKENLENDGYTAYFDSTGTEIPTVLSKLATDSSFVEPGFIRRPTDQHVTFSVFFQDHLPNRPEYSMSMTLLFGSPLPFSPPNQTRSRNNFTSPIYGRVDIGFSALLFQNGKKELRENSIFKKFNEIWATLEVFNLLGNPNVVSYSWVKDLNGLQYAIPNRLTSRRLNARIIVKF